VLYRAHHALAATTPGTEAHQRAQGRWQRAFTDIDAHRVLQASDAAKGLLHPAAAKVIAPRSATSGTGWPATRTCRSCRWIIIPMAWLCRWPRFAAVPLLVRAAPSPHSAA
jgi:hypothetical protein